MLGFLLQQVDIMKRVAFPVDFKAGMETELSMHFGNARYFCILDIDESSKTIINHELIDNIPHSQGGCMAPVNLLSQNNVDILIVNGIGGRPLQGFQKVGITVLNSTDPNTRVKELVANLSHLPALEQSTCGGHM